MDIVCTLNGHMCTLCGLVDLELHCVYIILTVVCTLYGYYVYIIQTCVHFFRHNVFIMYIVWKLCVRYMVICVYIIWTVCVHSTDMCTLFGHYVFIMYIIWKLCVHYRDICAYIMCTLYGHCVFIM